ncbi:hypothetical protein EZV73_16065 [Acidaminobacter sp. JC074]|uniref:hypothetical protein n=1 Tax=Acidaminobacter sp. JC074 TaxID=2530199 RepID=UPI001F0CE0DF|nr:hypothetical protein [Acidaminobacter sp. JC074]MCH4889112.1 hypothetical protein [Acidaminobacter sp. JC074]
MYLIALIVTLIIMMLAVFGSGLFYVFDSLSLIVVFGVSIALLLVTGLWRDFKRSVRIMFIKKNPYNLHELYRAKLSVTAFQALLLTSGLYGTVLGLIALLQGNQRPNIFLPSVSVSLITLFYSLTAIIILMPIRFKIKSLIIDLEHKND